MSVHDRRTTWVRRPLPAIAGAAVLGALSFAQPAMATPGCYGDCQPGVVRGSGNLKYDTLVGVNDHITVSVDNGVVTLTNPDSTLTVGTGCTLVNAHQASCSPATNTFKITIRSLNGDDTITNATGIASFLRGGDGADHLIGGSGDDQLSGGFGPDLIDGGAGADTADYGENGARIGIVADLDGAVGDDGSAEDGPAGVRDTIAADVENLHGTNVDDVLIGNAGPNVIDGAGGRSQIQGLGGDDVLTGRGNGTLNGGAGSDQCTSDMRLSPTTPDAFAGCEHTAILLP